MQEMPQLESRLFPVRLFLSCIVLLVSVHIIGCVPVPGHRNIQRGGPSAHESGVTAELLQAKGLFDKGEYRQAREVCERVLPEHEKEYGSRSLEVANILFMQGDIYRKIGLFSKAVDSHRTCLEIMQERLGKNHPLLAASHNNLGLVYTDQGAFGKAEQAFDRALAINADGRENDHETAIFWDNLGHLYKKQGKFKEAETAHKKALGIKKNLFGEKAHQSVAISLNNLGLVYVAIGNYHQAIEVFQRSLAVMVDLLGERHPDVAVIWDNIGQVYLKQGRFSEAETALKKALEIKRDRLGDDHPLTALSINNLGHVYHNQGKYLEAEKAYKESFAISVTVFGERHPDIGMILDNLGNVYSDQGRYSEAEQALVKALSIKENSLGENHPDTIAAINNLGLVHEKQGKFIKAETAYKRALALNAGREGDDQLGIANVWSNLGNIYIRQGRYAEAEEVLTKAMTIQKGVLGEGHPAMAVSYNNLGFLHETQGLYRDAEGAYRKALNIERRVHGEGHPSAAIILTNLGMVYKAQGRFRDAREVYQQALDIRKQQLGREHPDTAQSIHRLASLLEVEGKTREAAERYGQVVAMTEKKIPDFHPVVAVYRNDYARALAKLKTTESLEEALRYSRMAVRLLEGETRTESGGEIFSKKSSYFNPHEIVNTHLDILSKAEMDPLISTGDFVAESFIVAQRAQINTVAAAIARMTARMAEGQSSLAALVSRRQDLIAQEAAAERQMMKAIYEENGSKSELHKKALITCRQKLLEIDTRLGAEFPKYVELSNPKPVTMQAVQTLLDEDEALLTIVLAGQSNFLWLIRHDTSQWWKLDISESGVSTLVKEVRAGLDPMAITDSGLPEFNVGAAQQLYEKLIKPAEAFLDNVKQIFVVADGALQSIPFGIMVKGRDSTSSYQDVNWLTTEYAFSYLPSVSSFKALRTLGGDRDSTMPFLGFGDPVLGGRDGELRVATVFDHRGTGLADLRGIRQLASLPETAEELNALAKTLGASPESVNLKEKASEARVKNMDLAHARVIAFATHGLVAGDFKFLGEPALVLTPPEQATEENDGLLTAGEVSQLHLNAEWVILSACNTAAPDGSPGAEGFSGLAKAFFYAGARSLLVSHWPVDSQAALETTTNMFRSLTDYPGISKSEALRRSRLQLIQNREEPFLAHPLLWAPFVVVGDATKNY